MRNRAPGRAPSTKPDPGVIVTPPVWGVSDRTHREEPPMSKDDPIGQWLNEHEVDPGPGSGPLTRRPVRGTNGLVDS